MRAGLLRVVALVALFMGAAGPGLAEPVTLPSLCERVVFEETAFVTCAVDPQRHDIRLFHRGPGGLPYGSLESFAAYGPAVVFAMNAGMYLPDLAPQGLYIEDGNILSPLSTGDGDGNFHLKPNGVFMVMTDGQAAVVETEAFGAMPMARYATQSGPMLVIGGSLHPAFAENGDSRFIRNGVGVRADGIVVFAISLSEVSFGRFARLFRDALHCPDALYLDGFVSELADDKGVLVGGGHAAGPIVAVIER